MTFLEPLFSEFLLQLSPSFCRQWERQIEEWTEIKIGLIGSLQCCQYQSAASQWRAVFVEQSQAGRAGTATKNCPLAAPSFLPGNNKKVWWQFTAHQRSVLSPVAADDDGPARAENKYQDKVSCCPGWIINLLYWGHGQFLCPVVTSLVRCYQGISLWSTSNICQHSSEDADVSGCSWWRLVGTGGIKRQFDGASQQWGVWLLLLVSSSLSVPSGGGWPSVSWEVSQHHCKKSTADIELMMDLPLTALGRKSRLQLLASTRAEMLRHRRTGRRDHVTNIPNTFS